MRRFLAVFGLAPLSDVRELEQRVEDLQAELKTWRDVLAARQRRIALLEAHIVKLDERIEELEKTRGILKALAFSRLYS